MNFNHVDASRMAYNISNFSERINYTTPQKLGAFWGILEGGTKRGDIISGYSGGEEGKAGGEYVNFWPYLTPGWPGTGQTFLRGIKIPLNKIRCLTGHSGRR